MIKRTRELDLRRRGYRLIAGTDEAGRGAWAGPLVAAAVIMKPDFFLAEINDSKLLNSTKRDRLFDIIIKNSLAYNLHFVDHQKIDRVGVGQANLDALTQAVFGLSPQPSFILIDGFRIHYPHIPSAAVIKGDRRIFTIACASILAKVSRDRHMSSLASRYPSWQFDKHKGYGTKLHRELLDKYGLCAIHRHSFRPIALLDQKNCLPES